MSEQKCTIYYDLIINGNEYYPERVWHRRIPNEDKEGDFCCEAFKNVYLDGHLNHCDSSHIKHHVGLNYQSYEDTLFEPFRFCPFCSAIIEYKLKWKYKMVNKPKDCWQKEPYFGSETVLE
jgi:hypothetical protein